MVIIAPRSETSTYDLATSCHVRARWSDIKKLSCSGHRGLGAKGALGFLMIAGGSSGAASGCIDVWSRSIPFSSRGASRRRRGRRPRRRRVREDARSRSSRSPPRSEPMANPSAPSAIAPQPAAGPASFADIVDRVKPAVVSVKVKLSDADPVDDEESPGPAGFPAQNSPFYHFFRHFGLPGASAKETTRAAPSFDAWRRVRDSSSAPTATSSPITTSSTTPRR